MRKIPSNEKLKKLDELFFKAGREKTIKKQEKFVKEARNFARHENMLISEKWRDKFCRKCNSWFNSKNQKIRLSNEKISRECLNCHDVYRKKFKD